jgi:hypothetical protein
LHFYHHGLAAITKGPAHWLAEAFERKAMKQRMGHLRDEYNARWGIERKCSVVF